DHARRCRHHRGRVGPGGRDHVDLRRHQAVGRTSYGRAAAVDHREPVPELDADQRRAARHGAAVGGLPGAARAAAGGARADLQGRAGVGRPAGDAAGGRCERPRHADPRSGERSGFEQDLGSALPRARGADRVPAAPQPGRPAAPARRGECRLRHSSPAGGRQLRYVHCPPRGISGNFPLMHATYNPWLVTLSIIVAILVSYTALRLTERVAGAERRAGRLWVLGGAVSMGIGIWSMHFIGMLAFSVPPVTLRYNLLINLASLFVGMLTSLFALSISSRSDLSLRRLAVSSILMGAGICGMHYTGMAAIQIVPAITYS